MALTGPVSADQGRPRPRDVGPLAVPGGYVIQSCGEAGSSEGWSLTRSDPDAVDAGSECPPHRGNQPMLPGVLFQTGIWVSDRLGNAGGSVDTPAGSHAEATFAVVPGTSIVRARFFRRLSKRSDDNWKLWIGVADGNADNDSCDMNGAPSCVTGADDWYPDDPNPDLDRLSYRDLGPLSATSFVVGVRCADNSNHLCGNGTSLTRADASIFSAFFTIADPTPPAVGSPVGDGWTTGDWAQGSLALAVGSSDATGILATSVYADGSLIASRQGSCRYDRPRPCADEPTGAVGLPVAGLADGPHTIDLVVADAAGNTVSLRRPQPLLVDTRAPAAPVGLRSPVVAATATAFSADWSLPADAGTPIDAARYQVCQGGSCGPVAAASGLTHLDAQAPSGSAPATLRVWLVDSLGHEAPGAAATVALTRASAQTPGAPAPPPGADPPAIPLPIGCCITPTLPVTPSATTKAAAALRLATLRRVGRRVTVAGTLTRLASGRVTIRYRVRRGGRSSTLTARAAIRGGAWHTTLTLPSRVASARSATVTVTYAGDADTRPGTRSATLRLSR